MLKNLCVHCTELICLKRDYEEPEEQWEKVISGRTKKEAKSHPLQSWFWFFQIDFFEYKSRHSSEIFRAQRPSCDSEHHYAIPKSGVRGLSLLAILERLMEIINPDVLLRDWLVMKERVTHWVASNPIPQGDFNVTSKEWHGFKLDRYGRENPWPAHRSPCVRAVVKTLFKISLEMLGFVLYISITYLPKSDRHLKKIRTCDVTFRMWSPFSAMDSGAVLAQHSYGFADWWASGKPKMHYFIQNV